MINFKELKKVGHFPTLLMAFLYFDISFMVWTMLGPLGPEIKDALSNNGTIITDNQLATLLSLPILGGALLRILLGFLVDKIGPKKTAIMSQLIVISALFYTYFKGANITYNELLLVAFALGFAGASFAVALPQAGQWYPPKLQGVVLGIAGAGNIGVVLDFIFAPKIAELFGWEAVFGIGGVLNLIVFILYIILAKDAPKKIYTPRPKKIKDYIKLLKDKDTWWFSLFYAVSFGGFVGFASYMKIYLIETYPKDLLTIGKNLLHEENINVVAGYIGAILIFAGAVLRAVGGSIADKIGGVKALYIFYGSISIFALILALGNLNFYLAFIAIAIIMASLGMANGAIFQLVPQKFGEDMGIMTGIIGAAGGFGGTILIKILGWSKTTFDSYSAGFMIFEIIILFVLLFAIYIRRIWILNWKLDPNIKI